MAGLLPGAMEGTALPAPQPLVAGAMESVGANTPAPEPVTYRAFDDIEGQRRDIYGAAIRGLTGKAVENEHYRLEVLNPHYRKDYRPTLAEEKQAILRGETLHNRLHGTLQLTDRKTGQVVDSRDTVLAHIPHLNARGMFIRNGSVWLGRNQQRLRSGVYGRKTADGSVEAMVNAKRGRGFRVEMDPTNGQFRLNVQQSTTRLYPVLRALGIKDEDLKAAWGQELFDRNYRAPSGNDLKDLTKLVGKLGNTKEKLLAPEMAGETLKGILSRTELDPETTARTVGQPIRHLHARHLVDFTKKLLRINRGEEEGDNRDHQAFQSTHGVEDYIRERLENDRAGGLRTALWKATKDRNLSRAHSGLLTPNIDGLFQGSGLMVGTEDINPVDAYDQRFGIIRTGEGGISQEAVSRESRAVQASYLGLIDSNRTSDSGNVGLDLRVTGAAVKGSDNKLYTPVLDLKTGRKVMKSAQDLHGQAVAFPGEMEKPGLRVRALRGDRIGYVKRDEIAYQLPDLTSMWSPSTSLVPMPEGIKGQRLLMGTKVNVQSLPLEGGEAPLVQTGLPDGTSLHQKIGQHLGVVRARGPGQVLEVTPDSIKIQYRDGVETHDLFNNYAHSRKTASHNEAQVKPGDTVAPGQVLAHSNWTDRNGVMAMGRNLRTAWMTGKGATHEDAIVISESAAKKLTSQHLYKHDVDFDNIESTEKAAYVSVYGDRFKKDALDRLGDDGIVKEGQTVQPGDPLVLGIGRKTGRAIGAVAESSKSGFSDRSKTWDHHSPGVVTDVVKTRDGVNVTVKSLNTAELSDKLSSLYGNKGVVSKIVPDHLMPHDEAGQPMEVLFNAVGVVSRTNPAVAVSALLGKVAQKTGKPYILQPGSVKEGLTDFALNEAKLHGVKELEDLTDPETGRKIPNVFTGISHILKLHHIAESKLSGRDGGSYDLYGAPAKGGPQGAKRVGGLAIGALLAHGATEYLKDAKLVRGQRNDAYWRSVRSGETPQAPQRSFANDHFRDLLTAAGVSVRQEGSVSKLAPLLDRDVDGMAEHEIENSKTFDWKTMRAVDGGLFDPKATGGAGGTKWAKITLPVPIPHPLYEVPISKILGITKKTLDAVVAGEEQLGGKSGPEAVLQALRDVKVDDKISHLQGVVRDGAASKRDDAVKALGYLAGLKKAGIQPSDLMITRIPVLPARFRPIAKTDRQDIVHDVNYLYHDVMEAKRNLAHAVEVGDDPTPYLKTLHGAVRAVSDMGEPVGDTSKQQEAKGLLTLAIGKGESAKMAHYHRRVLGNSVDTVGRAVITAAPELDMDQIRIPPGIAWQAYRPFVIRRLVQQGTPASEAVKQVKERTKGAEMALRSEMKVRPVVYNRDPALHKYSHFAGWPVLGPEGDDSIAMSYYVNKPMGADADGDQINIHVPVSDKAVEDSINKMMPSKNLLSVGTGEAHLEPQQDYVLGLHMATRSHDRKPARTFRTADEAKAAYQRGEIGMTDPVHILGS